MSKSPDSKTKGTPMKQEDNLGMVRGITTTQDMLRSAASGELNPDVNRLSHP